MHTRVHVRAGVVVRMFVRVRVRVRVCVCIRFYLTFSLVYIRLAMIILPIFTLEQVAPLRHDS